MSKALIAFVACIALFISGCDFAYGVGRTVRVPFYPPTQCVLDAANAIGGVSEIVYVREDGGRPLTLAGVGKPDEVHRFFYEYEGVKNNFYFLVSEGRQVELHHGYGSINQSPPQDHVDRIYPFIRSLEVTLEERCQLKGQFSAVEEWCREVSCPSS